MTDAPAPACGECSAPMILRESKYGLFWGCSKYPICKGTHGAHPDGIPLGIPGGPDTRAARVRAHAAFDGLWKGGWMSRRAAYRWLSKKMGRKEIHIGALTTDECRDVEVLCAEFTPDRRHQSARDARVAEEDAMREMGDERDPEDVP